MTRVGESLNRDDNLSCNYGIKENAVNDRTMKKKSLKRCEECGKGFRYEKCLLNHRKVMHCEEYKRRILFRSFSTVQKRKRSKRIFRCKKGLRRFSVFSKELLEVAESLILLSKSGTKFLKLVGEVPDSNLDREITVGSLRNEQKLVGDALDQKLVGMIIESDGTSKLVSGFLGDKKDDETEVGRQRVRLEDSSGMILQNPETAFEGLEHQCRLCDKIFSSYQALGGHQTFHRMRKKKLKSQTKRCREESEQVETEINDSMMLGSVQELRGHNKRTFGFNMNVSMITGGTEWSIEEESHTSLSNGVLDLCVET